MGAYRNGLKQDQPYRDGVKMNAYRNGVKMFSGEPLPVAEFWMVVNSGADSQFILPLKYGSGTAHHELTIDWGDGNVQVTTGNVGITAQFQGLTHAYPAANTEYTIAIAGKTFLDTEEISSYFGLGFYSNTTGYNATTNKTKLKRLLGSLESITSANRVCCYFNMFYGCSGLTEIPAALLPATTLAESCYSSMFANCTGLTNIPATLLPATTLSDSCYNGMFQVCTGLTEVSATLLPAANPGYGCYAYMFNKCSGLVSIYMTSDWFVEKEFQVAMFGICIGIVGATLYSNIPNGFK
jgi:hypothetical protein